VSVKDHIRGYSSLTHYRKGYLYYETNDTKFTYRVPVDDTGDATFNIVEKSMTMMRYIRKEIDAQNADPSDEE